jgi:aminoglycoside/choline kinase family phosphotransferase
MENYKGTCNEINKLAFMDIISSITGLFRKWSGHTPLTIKRLPDTASGRKYYRLQADNIAAMGVYNNNKRENQAFLYLSAHLKKYDVNVPAVYGTDIENGVYLIEDLGDNTLYSFIEKARDNKDFMEQAVNMYKKVVDNMPGIQVRASGDMDFSICYPRPEFDYQSIMWDLNYFKYYFLRLAGVTFNEQYLEEDFQSLAKYLLQADCNYFLYRDFQSRNIMIKGGDLYFIDYQGGRRGALQYDLASLLFEAKIQLPAGLRQEILDHYIRVFSRIKSFNSEEFLKYYPSYILIRLMQAMGAYGLRGYYEHRSFFLRSIPHAVDNMDWLLHNHNIGIKIPALMDCLRQITGSKEIREYGQERPGLTVSINSFSYIYGSVPQDNTGNGGGFIFDCRAMPNPGIYPQFSNMTGKDSEVIEFLEKKEEVIKFADNVYSIIEASINNYRKRNFANLMISFGCTGGRHRSVYFAEHIAKRIKDNFNISIKIRHRELEKIGYESNDTGSR